MNNGTDGQASGSGLGWYDELGLIPRFPRPPLKQIAALIESIKEPRIFLVTNHKNTDIVIRFPMSSRIFSPAQTKAFEKFKATLPKAFDDILWQKHKTTGNMAWSELARVGMDAYREAWNQWAMLQYRGHFHPAADAMFDKIKEEVDLASKTDNRGRSAGTQAELLSLEKRYNQLFPKCKLVYRAAKKAVASARAKNNQVLAGKETRRSIWDAVRPSVHGMPGDGYIFGGKAFDEMNRQILKSKKVKKLHVPRTWNPHQLAVILLALERKQTYQTIEKKVARAKRMKQPPV